MKEIALHIMDIVQNSITANATLIEISLEIARQADTVSITAVSYTHLDVYKRQALFH